MVQSEETYKPNVDAEADNLHYGGSYEVLVKKTVYIDILTTYYDGSIPNADALEKSKHVEGSITTVMESSHDFNEFMLETDFSDFDEMKSSAMEAIDGTELPTMFSTIYDNTNQPYVESTASAVDMLDTSLDMVDTSFSDNSYVL